MLDVSRVQGYLFPVKIFSSLKETLEPLLRGTFQLKNTRYLFPRLMYEISLSKFNLSRGRNLGTRSRLFLARD